MIISGRNKTRQTTSWPPNNFIHRSQHTSLPLFEEDWRKMKLSEPGRQKIRDFLAAGKTYKVTSLATPGVKEGMFDNFVLPFQMGSWFRRRYPTTDIIIIENK